MNDNRPVTQSPPCRAVLFCLGADWALSDRPLWPHHMTHPTPCNRFFLIIKRLEWSVGHRSVCLSLTLHVATWRYTATTCITIQVYLIHRATKKDFLSWAFRRTRQQLCSGANLNWTTAITDHDSVKPSSLVLISVAGKITYWQI